MVYINEYWLKDMIFKCETKGNFDSQEFILTQLLNNEIISC